MVKMVRGGEGGGVEGSRVRGAEGARGGRGRGGEEAGAIVRVVARFPMAHVAICWKVVWDAERGAGRRKGE